MKRLMFAQAAVLAAALVPVATIVSMSTAAQAADLQSTKAAVQQKIYEITGKDSAVVDFAKGSSTVTDSEKSGLKAVVNAVRENDVVKETIVLAYADTGYPRNQKADLPKAARELAEARGAAVKTVLNDLGAKDVKVYSMAEKSNWLEKTFVTSTAQIKGEAKEKAGSTDEDDAFYQALGQQLKAKGGSGKVVVVVRHASSSAH